MKLTDINASCIGIGDILKNRYGDCVSIIDFSYDRLVIHVSTVKNHEWYGASYTFQQLKDLGYEIDIKFPRII
jgi:hypothetical protein